MPFRWQWRTQLCALLISAGAIAVSGCASCRLCPRIDPSGERIFIWPGETPPAVGPPATAIPAVPPPAVVTTPPPPPPVVTTPPPPTPTVGLPQGNLQAPPAYPDAGLPATPPPVITVPPAGSPPATVQPFAPPAAPVVDAQLAFPAPTIAQAGHPLVLTTIVTRRSDRAPLSGWTVRYEVSGPGAGLGPAGGSRVEVPTDNSGRASIEISPASIGLGQATVSTAVFTPPDAAGTTAIGSEVGRSTATITWRGGVPGAPWWPPSLTTVTGGMVAPSLAVPPTTLSPTPVEPAPSYPNSSPPPNRFEPPPSLADDKSPPKTYSPPPPPAGKPELTVEVRRRGPEQAEVGSFVSFDVVVTNRGDATARGIKVLDRFDPGLGHMQAQDSELAVKYEGMRELPPGDSQTVPLTFGVRAAGRQCHHVTVTADGAAAVTESGCVTGIDAKPAMQPALEVTKIAPIQHFVGEIAKFRTVIKNTGEVAVTNVEVIDHYDDPLDPRATDAGREQLPNGDFRWKIARLEVGEKREIKVQCACMSPTRSACTRVTVTADGDISYADEKCVEIMLARTATPSAPTGGTSPPPLPAKDLKVSLRTTANPARVGAPLTLFVFVENVGVQTQRSVAVRIQLPQETAPNSQQIEPAGAFEIVGQREIRFANVGEIPPGERREFKIPLTVDGSGVVTFAVQASAAGLSQPIVAESDPIQIEAAAQ